MSLLLAQQAYNKAFNDRKKAQTAYDDAVRAVTNKQNEIDEYTRQFIEHSRSNPPYVDGANYAANEVNKRKAELPALNNAVTLTKNALDAAEDELTSKKSILDIAVAADTDAKAEIEFAKTNPEAYASLQAQKAALASGQATTKYLIIGAIALTLVVIAVFMLRKKFAA